MILSPPPKPCSRHQAVRPARRVSGLLFVLIWAFAFPTMSLNPETLPSQYLFTGWQDELPQNTVQAMVQTREGYLWIGTQGGLSRFDGVRFVDVVPHEEGIAGSIDVRALLEDAQGRLWVGTRGEGLLVWEGGKLRPEPALQSLGSRVVFSIAEGTNNDLWLGTRNSGVVHLTAGEARSLSQEQGLASERIFSVLEDSRGVLWAGASQGGLSRFDGSKFISVGGSALRDVTILSLMEDKGGKLWLGTRQSGLFQLDPLDEESVHQVSGPAESPITEGIMDLYEDHHGNIWAATYGGGLLRLGLGEAGPGEAQAVTTDSGLSSQAVMSLLEDREKNLWVGTEGGGLNRLQDGAFRTFGRPEGLDTEQTWTVLEDGKGVIWVGTEGSGLARIEGNRVSHLGTAQGLSSDSITALLEDTNGDLWVGGRGRGLNRLRNGSVRVFDKEDGLSNNTILAMAEDPKGALWLGTPGKGLSRRVGDRFESIQSHPELIDNLILALAIGPRGELIVGTDTGLKILHEGRVEVYDSTNGLANDSVFALLAEERVEKESRLWIGTYGGGLSLFEEGRFFNFDRSHGLASDVILQILDDGLGFLWLGSNQGISRVSKSELSQIAASTSQTLNPTSFGKADGMRAAECNGGYQPSAWKDTQGRLWFSTIRGTVTVDPARLSSNPVPPGVVIESINADGSPLPISTHATRREPVEVRLPAGLQRFEITYAGLSFRHPEKVEFRYRLQGYDRDWIEAGTERRATYTNLPSGKAYRFHVLAANEDGIWNDDGAAYTFYIEPFIYQRPWFLGLSAAVLWFLGWLAYRLRVRHLVRRTAQLEALVSARTHEVVEQRDQLREANSQLTSLNRFKSEFLGIAAHDLKNPLSVIYAYAGVIAEKAADSPRLLRTARRISISTNQMLNIVSDLLDTTAMESGRLRFQPEQVHLSELISEILDRYQLAAAEQNLELRHRSEEQVHAFVDREKVTRIIENLLSNAIRYTREGTFVEVRLEGAGNVDANVDANSVRIAVIDDGPGLSAEQIPRIFDRFERLAAKHGIEDRSVGLGLSIVKQFVEIHQGRVWVESSPGKGAAFWVELPVSSPPQGPSKD